MKHLMATAMLSLAALTLSAFPSHAEDANKAAPVWFSAIDRNSDGIITLKEMHDARYQRFANVDADRDGLLSPTELKKDRPWLRRFGWFDANRDGRISIHEFEAKGQSRFVMLDANGDGRVSLREALRVTKAQRRSPSGTAG